MSVDVESKLIFKARREPVECSDIDDDKLSEMLSNCKISPPKTCSELENAVSVQLSNISIHEDNKDSERSTEVLPDQVQCLSSCKCSMCEALNARGPTNGCPSSYVPNNLTQDLFCHQFGFPNVNGKRGAEHDEVPFKFRPSSINNLDIIRGSPKQQNIPTDQISSHRHLSGGSVQVVPNLEYDLLLETDPDLLTVTGSCNFSQPDPADVLSDGYASENSPLNETPYSYSPPPSNLSNLSEDSGISSQGVRSPDNRSDNRSPEVSSSHHPSIDTGSPQNLNYSGRDYIDENKDELADVLTVLADDLMKEKKRKESEVAKRTQNVNMNTFVSKEYNFENCSKTNLYSFSCIKDHQMSKINTCLPQNQQYGQIQSVPQVNKQPAAIPTSINLTPVSSVPVTITPLNRITPSPVPVLPNKVPVTTGQYLIIAQPRPVMVFNQFPVPKQTKKQYVPILPKLPTVSNPSQQKVPSHTTESLSRVPTTVTAVASDSNYSTQRPIVANSNKRLPPSSTDNSNTNTDEDLRKLNLARRLVAKMTSNDLRFQDNEGDTYLVVAACKADKNMVQALLERLEREKLTGMIDVHNNLRQTALYCAVSANNHYMVDMLIRYGADVNTLAERLIQGNGCKEITAAIHVAASSGQEYLETLKALLKSKELNLNNANSDGQTALHCAILFHNKSKRDSNGFIDNTCIIETLIKHGADINSQDKKSGKTPLMYALESRNDHLIHAVAKEIKQDKMRTYLRTQSFDGNTAHKILESLKTALDNNTWHRVHDMVMCSDKQTIIKGHNINNLFY